MVELSLFLAWGIFAIGLGHCLYTFRVFKFGQPAIWFFGAGLAMMLLAALNLLSIQYHHGALPWLKLTVRTANLSTLVWALAAVLAFRGSLKRNPQVVVAFIVFAAMTVASFARE